MTQHQQYSERIALTPKLGDALVYLMLGVALGVAALTADGGLPASASLKERFMTAFSLSQDAPGVSKTVTAGDVKSQPAPLANIANSGGVDDV